MCGRYALYGPVSRLREAFDAVPEGFDFEPRWNAASSRSIFIRYAGVHRPMASACSWPTRASRAATIRSTRRARQHHQGAGELDPVP